MKLWELYLSKGRAPDWSSTFQKEGLQIGALPFRRQGSNLEQYLSEGRAPDLHNQAGLVLRHTRLSWKAGFQGWPCRVAQPGQLCNLVSLVSQVTIQYQNPIYLLHWNYSNHISAIYIYQFLPIYDLYLTYISPIHYQNQLFCQPMAGSKARP